MFACNFQAKLQLAFPGEAFDLLPYLLYSDEAVVRLGGYKFHTLILFPGQPLEQLRAAHNFLPIAYLPVVGPGSGLDGERYRLTEIF